MQSKLMSRRRSPLRPPTKPRRTHLQQSKGDHQGRYRRTRQVSHSLRHSSTVKPRRLISVQTMAAVKEAIAWIITAMLLRLGVDGIMALSSQFWLLGVMVACFPAVIAIWMTRLSPQRGFILGYRCLLVMVGLLLGGKLGVLLFALR